MYLQAWIIEHGDLDWKRGRHPTLNVWNVGTALIESGFRWFLVSTKNPALYSTSQYHVPGKVYWSVIAAPEVDISNRDGLDGSVLEGVGTSALPRLDTHTDPP